MLSESVEARGSGDFQLSAGTSQPTLSCLGVESAADVESQKSEAWGWASKFGLYGLAGLCEVEECFISIKVGRQ